MFKRLFVFIETIVYVVFILLDLLKINSTYIKYLGIILCLLFVIYNKNKIKTVAMLFTCLADLFLLVLNKYYELGVTIFIGTQLTYLYYLGNINKKYFKFFLKVRVVLMLLGSLVLSLTNNLSLLNELVIVYFTNLLVNCFNAIKVNKKLFALGLLLFVCCDVCVGLHNISTSFTVATFLMWVFYLPSQVLIVLS